MLNRAPGREGMSRLAPQRGPDLEAQRKGIPSSEDNWTKRTPCTKYKGQTPWAWSVGRVEGRAESKAGEIERNPVTKPSSGQRARRN